MKKTTLIAALALVLCGCRSDGIRYRVKGTIPNLSGEISLVTNDTVLGRQTVKDGKVDFRGTIDKPTLAFLRDGQGEYVASMFLENGTVTLSDTEPVGTPANDASKRYMTQIGQLVNKFYSPETTKEEREALQERETFLKDSTINANLDNIFGVVLFVQDASGTGTGAQQARQTLEKFTAEMQAHPYLIEIKKYIETMGRTDVGAQFIDITLSDKDGNPVALSEVVARNKYVLLDFWASWCGPCMGEIPYLKEDYQKYHKMGFEIYGVSIDEDKDSWLSTIREKEMTWIQVCSPQGWHSDAVREYGVQSIPASWLISGDGTIVARNLRGESLGEKLSELLK